MPHLVSESNYINCPAVCTLDPAWLPTYISSHTMPPFQLKFNKLTWDLHIRDFYMVSALPTHPAFDNSICSHNTFGPQRGRKLSDYSNLVGEGPWGSLGSSGEFSYNLRLLQGYGWLKEVGGHGNCIKEPVNVMSSVVRMHKASTVPMA